MFKNFKILFLIIGLTILDVVSLPTTCYPYQLGIVLNVTNEEENIAWFRSGITTYKNINPGQLLTEEQITSYIETILSIKDTDFSYSTKGNVQEKTSVNVTSYQIESFEITKVGDDGYYGTNITFPYKTKTTDYQNYYNGKRQILVLEVYLNIEYEIVNE